MLLGVSEGELRGKSIIGGINMVPKKCKVEVLGQDLSEPKGDLEKAKKVLKR